MFFLNVLVEVIKSIYFCDSYAVRTLEIKVIKLIYQIQLVRDKCLSLLRNHGDQMYDCSRAEGHFRKMSSYATK